MIDLIVANNSQIDSLMVVMCFLQNVVQSYKGLSGIDDLSLDLVLSNKDASLRIGGSVSGMYQYTLIARHIGEPWHLSPAEVLEERFLQVFRRYEVHQYAVDAGRDGGDGSDFSLQYLFQRHLGVQSPVTVLYGVTEVLSVDVKVSYAVFVVIVRSLQ